MLTPALLSPTEIHGSVAVVTGGTSRERERALLSGCAVVDSLRRQGLDPMLLDARDDLISRISGAGVAFLAIAGRHAEDGRLQGLLESLNVPYTGSGVRASAIGMHKPSAKALVERAGVPVAVAACVNPGASVREIAEFGFPAVLKPQAEGCSIDLEVVPDEPRLAAALTRLRHGDQQLGQPLMVERFHTGQSVTVGVLEDIDHHVVALPPLATLTKTGVYTNAAKDDPELTSYLCPAPLPDGVLDQLGMYARTAHQVIGAHGYSRSDFVVTDSGDLVWLELNTLPGLTPGGNLARMAGAAGIGYDHLIAHLARSAFHPRRET